MMETLVTTTEKQTTQPTIYEEAARDLMERLAQLKEEITRVQTTLKLKERSQAPTELTTLGKPKSDHKKSNQRLERVVR